MSKTHKEFEIYLVQADGAKHAESLKKIKNVKELEEKSIRFHGPMEGDLIGRLQVYEVEGRQWKAEPKVKRIYKQMKKERHSKIIKEFKPKITPRSLKKDEAPHKWYL